MFKLKKKLSSTLICHSMQAFDMMLTYWWRYPMMHQCVCFYFPRAPRT